MDRGLRAPRLTAVGSGPPLARPADWGLPRGGGRPPKAVPTAQPPSPGALPQGHGRRTTGRPVPPRPTNSADPVSLPSPVSARGACNASRNFPKYFQTI